MFYFDIQLNVVLAFVDQHQSYLNQDHKNLRIALPYNPS